MHLHKKHYKNQNMKNQLQFHNYSSNNATSSFKQAKCCNICPLENLKITFLSASLPACLPTGTDQDIAKKL